MKDTQKVTSDHIKNIQKNNLEVVNYFSRDHIECECKKCGHKILDNYRNLSYKNFRCKYCTLISKSNLIKNGDVSIEKIEGSFIHLICKKGHRYKQDRRNLLSGKRCQKCYLENKILPKEVVIRKFKEIHGNYYQYKFDEFKNLHSFVNIICPKGHKFTQKVSNHLQGKACPICKESLGERTISNYLSVKNINFVRQKKFKNCFYISQLVFDFYLPELNTVIEYDGLQHFQPLVMFGGEEEFKKTQIRDKIKTEYCLNNNIRLIRISYKENVIDRINADL